MKWPDPEPVLQTINVPEGFHLEQLRVADVPEVVAALATWYPDIVVGAESRHLEPAFYLEQTFLVGGSPTQDVLPIVAKHRDKLAALATYEKNSRAKTVFASMGAAAPEARGLGIAHFGPAFLEAVGKAMGAGLVFYYATLKLPHQQAVAEKQGFRLVGIMPGNDCDMVAPGCVKRVYEALYAKVLVPDAEMFLPPEGALTPKTKALWDFLFKEC